jgi:hypothetical protein
MYKMNSLTEVVLDSIFYMFIYDCSLNTMGMSHLEKVLLLTTDA